MWVDEAMQRDAIAFEQTKRQEKLKKEREMAMNRKLKSKATNKLSLPSIIQAKIMSKLSKTSKYIFLSFTCYILNVIAPV